MFKWGSVIRPVPDAQPPIEDRLGRAELAARFCLFLSAGTGARLYMVDGDWGSGKSVFMGLCAAELRQSVQPAMRVVEFNAWKQSHTKNPLLDLTYFISSQVTQSRTSRLRRQARLAARQIAVGLGDVVGRKTYGLLNLRALFTPRRSEWEQAQRRLAAFHRQLAKLATEAPLVVLIDDVDRCEPHYAAQLLERAFVMFEVPGVHVVLAAHRDALERSIRSVHGEHYASHSYLQGVIRHCLELPQVPAQAVSELIGADLGAAADSLGIDESDFRDICDVLALVPLCVYGGIRNVERVTEVATRRLAEMTAPGVTGAYAGSLQLGGVLVLAAALAALQLISPAAHRSLLRCPTDGAAACRRLHAELEDRLDRLRTDPHAEVCWQTLCTCLAALGGTGDGAGTLALDNDMLGSSFGDDQLAQMREHIVRLRAAHHDDAGEAAQHAGIELPVRRWSELMSRAIFQT